ncbi:hypothetical protein, partial [Lyngbya sp. CCY1209]|uniref:hypothetical protein n=1 Tax=Lyngbya sp. CCY1209 TaxID=2886103 RepID=UPI002D2026BD
EFFRPGVRDAGWRDFKISLTAIAIALFCLGFWLGTGDLKIPPLSLTVDFAHPDRGDGRR